MDYPLKFLVETVLKKYLKNYFETDKMNLDSLSFLNCKLLMKF